MCKPLSIASLKEYQRPKTPSSKETRRNEAEGNTLTSGEVLQEQGSMLRAPDCQGLKVLARVGRAAHSSLWWSRCSSLGRDGVAQRRPGHSYWRSPLLSGCQKGRGDLDEPSSDRFQPRHSPHAQHLEGARLQVASRGQTSRRSSYLGEKS